MAGINTESSSIQLVGNTMTKTERACKDMADVCELAHKRTVRFCNKFKIKVNCASVKDCGDEGQVHDDPDFTHYSSKAQRIFDDHYDHIINVTGL